MNRNLTPAEINESLLKAAAELSHRLPPKVQLLLPHQKAVAELRRFKCSYRFIALHLSELNVKVSYQTVGKFCRLVLGEKIVRRGKRKAQKPVATKSETVASPSKVTEILDQQRSKSSPLQSYRPAKGPRIVNPKDL